MARVIEWLRLPGDLLIIVGGILPIVYLAFRMFKLRNRYEHPAPDRVAGNFTGPATGVPPS